MFNWVGRVINGSFEGVVIKAKVTVANRNPLLLLPRGGYDACISYTLY